MSTKNEDLFMLLYCKAEATGSCEPSGCLLSPPKTPSCVSCKVHWVTAVPAGLLLMGEEMMGLLGIVSISSDPPGYCAQERSQKPSSRLCLHSEILCFLLLFKLSLLRLHLSTSVHLGVGACISQSKGSLEEGTV